MIATRNRNRNRNRNRLFPALAVALLCAFTQIQPVTLHIAGDSTAAAKFVERRPETGWGEALQPYFDIDHVRVNNLARGGRSTMSFVREGRWDHLLGQVKAGDYVFIQFGHNDAARDRPDRFTPPADYRKYLIQFVADVRAKRATPVLMTPVMRRRFRNGAFYDSHGEYPDLVRAVAREQNVQLIDMHRRSERVISELGEEKSKALFLIGAPGELANFPEGIEDNTHFSRLGAELMAAEVAEGIRELGLPIARRLRKPVVMARTDNALDSAQLRYLRWARAHDPAAGSPRSTDSTGNWKVTPVNEWTSGFFPGTLWLLFAQTRDTVYRNQAMRWTAPMAAIPRGSYSHDLGFQFMSTFGLGYKLTGTEEYRRQALNAAKLLAARFNPAVGAIKSWDWMPPEKPYPVIVDNMMNLELLFWGARQPGGDPKWRELAIQHARTTIANHLRADGGSFHVVVFDPKSGRVLEKITHQGAADSTTWARGQAWLIYGFTMAYRETGVPEFLSTAKRVADYALARMPVDYVHCWDYQVRPCDQRDASAAAIAASGLLELAVHANEPKYRRAAEGMLTALASPKFITPGHASLLSHAVGNKPAGTEIDVGISYADYYFVEAALRLHGVLPITPPVTTHRGELLRDAAERVRARDAAIMPAYRLLLAQADSAMAVGPFTVTSKQRTPPSGDKHDYVSYAPYWWPDSTRADGLPYVRRDGVINMALRRDSDVLRWYAMTDAVETLAQAWYFSADAKYAARAATLLRAWFLDPATRMNPHLKYGQAIPGVTEGRGIGIIDTRDLGRLLDAVVLLRTSDSWTGSDDAGLRQWMRSYVDWLLNSAHGKDEADEANNHGTWYDVQVASIALFVGDTALARRTAESFKTERIAKQIDQAGKQPLELARTRSLHYSVENLDGMTRMAEVARHAGVDLWNYRAPNGGGIRKAIEFLLPYAYDSKRKWPHPQITEEPADLFVALLARANAAYGMRDLSAQWPTHRFNLLYTK